ncbi:MAG: FG-GAP-like repeat-containing protein [Armatimonadota bacterium]
MTDTLTLTPWKRIPFSPEDGGCWLVAGDIDGDGEVEIVTARNVDDQDVHYTCTVGAYKLDGTRLWQWGVPGGGRGKLHHDVACQLHDWDGDGRLEVVLCAQSELVALDGATGKEKRRLPLPYQASDSLVFCDLSGAGHPSDVLVKTRYGQIWAFNYAGELLWTVEKPGGSLTAHQPVAFDHDGDGRDAVMAGGVLLNPDGSECWRIDFGDCDVSHPYAHLDCLRVVRRGETPADWRLAFTYCNALLLGMLDGAGRLLWAHTGEHFESIDVGHILPGVPGMQLAVDIDKAGPGDSPLWVVGEDGTVHTRMLGEYSRVHDLVDWTGDGLQDIVVAGYYGVFDGDGTRLASFDVQPGETIHTVLAADMTGDGIPDLLIGTEEGEAAYIFRNEHGIRPTPPAPPGTGINVTLY